MPQHAPSLQYNTTQRYFLVTDFFLTAFWLFVLLRLAILYPLTGARFLPGGIAEFYLNVLAATVGLELLNYMSVFRLIPGRQTVSNGLQKPLWTTLLITAFSRLSLAFILYNYSKTARSEAFALLILAQSIKEFFRWFYNFQKVRMFNNIPKFNRITRSFTYLISTPFEALATVYLLFQSLGYSSYQQSLTVYDFYIKSAVKVLIVLYFPVFYYIYKRTLTKYYFASPIIIHTQLKKLD